jgi:diguanylate cyclase (GGDEF)-like protein/PAS domain S-box-containing protein
MTQMPSSEFKSSRDLLTQLLRLSPDPVWILGDDKFVDCNDAAVTIFGFLGRDELLATHPSKLFPPTQPDGQDSLSKAERMFAIAVNDGAHRFEWKYCRADGTCFDGEITLTRIDLEGSPVTYCVCRDLTTTKQAEGDLRKSQAQLLSLSTMSSDWFWSQNEHFRFTEFSGAFANDFTPPANTIGKTRWELNVNLTPQQWESHRAILNAHLPFRNFEYPITGDEGELRWYVINGDPRFDETGRFIGYHGTGRNITAYKDALNQIQSLAFSDSLTGLPNRRLLMDRLKQAVAAASRHRRQGALMLIDLDDFKIINDTLGHDQGDLLLQQVAKRLQDCVRQCDTVARLGGDEFIVLLEDLSQDEQEVATKATAMGEKVIATLNRPYLVNGTEHRSTASIGVSLFDGKHLGNTEEALKQADLAMYQAKSAGRNTLRFFDPEMQAVVNSRAILETGLREAIALQQFSIHYQPQVNGGNCITGTESLLRWYDPRRGMVSPAEFIPVAEESGLILPLGQWVLNTACNQLALWAQQSAMAHITVSVNVSARQFHQIDFVDQVVDTLKRTGANPHRLKLELTESMLISDIEGVVSKMSALKRLGVCFSLDDFGTGYSSLAYLKRLPLDQLKIDLSFVRDILVDSNDAAISKMVTALAGSMGLTVIAEGVETQAQRDFLAGLGCLDYQGYLFSKPLPAAEFEALVYGHL